MADPLIGKKLGQYEITALLGHGGMADVYRAFEPEMKRDVAVKVLSSQLTKDQSFIERFRREVELIGSLDHPHIIPVYNQGTHEGVTYLTMRYVKGGTLTELIQQGALPLSRANAILQQIAGALDHAHRRGVIHRDLKPSNVLIDEQGNAYLADFGLARTIEPSYVKTLTEPGAMIGTPTYISPEQIQEGRSDTRSDIYSLGVMLYEMVTGRPPFTGDSVFAIMQAHIFKMPPRPREFRPDLPPAIEAVLEKVLRKKPEERYQHALELASDFSAAVQGQITTPLPAITQTRITGQFMRAVVEKPSTRLLAVGTAVVLLLILGLLAFMPRAVAPGNALADETLRPEVGTRETIQISDAEVEVARQRLRDSFVGVVACSLKTEYHASLARAARIRAEALNLPVRLESADEDAFQQAAIINSFVAQGAKALVICPLDEQTITPAIRAAQDAGVVVMAVGDFVYGKLSATFTLTNEEMGRKVGQFTADLIEREFGESAVVAILDYPLLTSVVKRADTMEATLRERLPNVRIVGRWQGGLAQDGETNMKRALEEHPDINVIMSINDAGAFGAIKALRAAGKAPDEVAIVSVDAEAEARRLIVAGEYFRASVDNDPVGTSALMVDGVVKMLAGGVVPRQVQIPGRMITRDVLLAATPTPGS